MRKVKVTHIENQYLFTLEDSDHKIYKKNMEFCDTTINIGDYIYIHHDVLDEPNIYTYGPLLENANVDDLIKIVKNDKDIYLQRYYG